MMNVLRSAVLVALGALAAFLLPGPSPVLAQSSGVAVPASRAAKNVAIITLKGEINGTLAASVKRRLNEAVEGKADAIVIEINSPGGELGAVFTICTAIKQCPIANTVAWVRPTAYSGGAIVALACREIVVAEACSFGDAAPIEVRFHAMIRTMGRSERAKVLAPILAEVIESARLRGYDEKLVQGFAMLGVELWLIENTRTGSKLFIDRAEFVRIFETEPPIMSPTLMGAPPVSNAPTGGQQTQPTSVAPPASDPAAITPAEAGTASSPSSAESGTATTAPSGGPDAEPTFQPASNQATAQLVKDLNLNLSGASTRPVITAAEKAEWRVVEYVSSGDSIYTLKRDQVQRYGLAKTGPGTNGTINDDAELKAFFGATALSRLEPSVFEVIAAFLSEGLRGMIIRGLLITIFLVAAFIELTHPGAVLPGAIAVSALALLFAPALLVGAGAWWPIAAVLAGMALLALEILVLPGFGVPGVVGMLLLFAGLVGTMLPAGASLFPGTVQGRSDLLYGSLTVVLAFVAAIGALFFLVRHLPRLPLINRLVLADARPDDDHDTDLIRVMEAEEAPARIGDEATVVATLRPSGRVQVGDRIVDVVSIGGVIEAGQRVRVIEVDGFRVVVEALPKG